MESKANREIRHDDGAVCIIPCGIDDVDSIYAAVKESLEQLIPYMSWCHPGYSRKETADYLELCEMAWQEGVEYQFKILDVADNRLLGLCGINHINEILRFGNLGYWVRTRSTGKGVATRASLLAVRFAFESLGLHRIEIVVDPANKASLCVAEKTGATREGVLRNRIFVHGKPLDAVMYSLIPDDMRRVD
ncbi:MAG: GNAT family protein [Planctomycetota bacterium]